MNELTTFAFIGGIGLPEIIAILVVGLLLFGKRLPEVGRRAGKTFIELKRGVRGLRDQIYDLDSLAEQEAAGEDHSYEQVIGQIDPAADDIVVEADDEDAYHDHHQNEDDHEYDDSEHADADEANDTPKD
jgi:sec-independent protein translocase protein TatA